jgi:formate dehydrogenase subunit gamma
LSLRQEYDAGITSSIVASFGAKPEMLLQILHRVVEHFAFVPEAAIRQLAEELNLSRADVHGVVSYYHDFRTEAPGRHTIKICQAEACQAMGSKALTEHAERALGLNLHESSSEITLEAVYCLGNCACSPAILVGDRCYGRVSARRFDAIVDSLRNDP